MTYNGYTMTWNDRQLMEMSMNGGQFEYTFQYNDQGIRTQKTNGSVVYRYTLNGSQIVSETKSTLNSNGTETFNHLLVYLYDESGAPIGLQYRATTYVAGEFDTYYFEKNIFGDIIAVYTEAGVKIGSYTYDAWGYCTPLPEPDATAFQKQIVRTLNPFRYRGYYYDTETGLYYLQSRYYNPAWGRFLNADGYVNANGDLIGFNMYAYCSNNPVMNIDPSGNWNWKNFWTGVTFTAIAVVGVALALPSGGTSVAITSTVILSAIATTGMVMTYAAATETTAVSDLSFSCTNGTESITVGVSLVVDFDSGGIELYPHVGKSKGCTAGVTYSTGFIDNYNGIGSYSGLFYQGGAGYYVGVNH